MGCILWACQEKMSLKFLECAELCLVPPGHLQLFLSPDGSRIVVIHARSSVFVWEADQGEGLFSSPREYIRGLWTQVLPSGGIPLPEPDFKETSIDAIFHTDSVCTRNWGSDNDGLAQGCCNSSALALKLLQSLPSHRLKKDMIPVLWIDS